MAALKACPVVLSSEANSFTKVLHPVPYRDTLAEHLCNSNGTWSHACLKGRKETDGWDVSTHPKAYIHSMPT